MFKKIGFSVPKRLESKADIQDAWAASEELGLAAIADGVSSSQYPRQWADILVKKFCDSPIEISEHAAQNWKQLLDTSRSQWLSYRAERLQRPDKKWFERADGIASSTFLGLKINPLNSNGKGTWEAYAVGDSCLFQIDQGDKIVATFPLTKSEEFSSVTSAIGSIPNDQAIVPKAKRGEFTWGDRFLLATDALAKWILSESQDDKKRWKQLLMITEQLEFEQFVEALRKDNLIANDDTTLLRLYSLSPAAPTTPDRFSSPIEGSAITSRPDSRSGAKSVTLPEWSSSQPVSASSQSMQSIPKSPAAVESIEPEDKQKPQGFLQMRVPLAICFLVGAAIGFFIGNSRGSSDTSQPPSIATVSRTNPARGTSKIPGNGNTIVSKSEQVGIVWGDFKKEYILLKKLSLGRLELAQGKLELAQVTPIFEANGRSVQFLGVLFPGEYKVVRTSKCPNSTQGDCVYISILQ
jgi:hypothetical protein